MADTPQDTEIAEGAAAGLVSAATNPIMAIIMFILAFIRILMSLFGAGGEMSEAEKASFDASLGDGAGEVIGGFTSSVSGALPGILEGVTTLTVANEAGALNSVGGKSGVVQSIGSQLADIPWWILAGAAFLLLKN